MTVKTLIKTVFFSSAAYPFVQVLLLPRTLSLSPLFFDFVALVLLVVASLILAAGTADRRRSGKGVWYLIVAIGAVVLYFNTSEQVRHLGDCLDFYWRKPRLEAHVAQLTANQAKLDAAKNASRHLAYRSYPPGEWYDVLPSGIIICTTGGEISMCYWGFAYSPTGKQPTQADQSVMGGSVFYWQHLTGCWYRWMRKD